MNDILVVPEISTFSEAGIDLRMYERLYSNNFR